MGSGGAKPPHLPVGRRVGHQRGGNDSQPTDRITPKREAKLDPSREREGVGPGVPSQQGRAWECTRNRPPKGPRCGRVELGRVLAPHVVGVEEGWGLAAPGRGLTGDRRGSAPRSAPNTPRHERTSSLSQELLPLEHFNLFCGPEGAVRPRLHRSAPRSGARRPPPTGALRNSVVALIVIGLTLGGFTFLGAGGTPGSGIGGPGNRGPFPVAAGQDTNATVWFNETGLPPGTGWSVLLGDSFNSSTTPSIGFVEPQGQYDYTIEPVGGYVTPNYSGFINVHDQNTTVSVPWTLSTYSVEFLETGLPVGTGWSVTFNGSTSSSSGPTITFTAPNGTYPFSVGPVPGYSPNPQSGSLTVNGAPITQTISWTQAAYSVDFTESGLPTGTSWSVTFNGATSSSSNPTISFTAPNGTYPFSVGPVPGYSPNPQSGSLTVNGAPITQTISWTQAAYAVTFSEGGLPSGTEWFLNITGEPGAASTTSSLTVNLPDGTYSFSIASTNKHYAPAPGTGTFTVDSGTYSQSVTFALVASSLVVTESGLPSSTSWYLNISGENPLASTTTEIAVSLPNGTYAYAVATGNKEYAPFPASGGFTIDGAGVAVSVPFSLNVYPLTFMEVGLPAGTSWSVVLGGPSSGVSTTPWINMTQANTTDLTFSLGLVPGFSPTPAHGVVQVLGGPVSVRIVFTTANYTVVFEEIGLALGTDWGANLSGIMHFSTGADIPFAVPNGTYAYTIPALKGSFPSPSTGSVTLDGNDTTVKVYWNTVTYPVSFLPFGLANGTLWEVTLGGYLQANRSGPIIFHEPSGSYGFSLAPLPGYRGLPLKGIVHVGTQSVTQFIRWTALTFPVSFSALGLAPGTAWGVEVGSIWHVSGATTISFELPNGTYAYRYSLLAGYRPVSRQGNLTVNGSSLGILSQWSPIVYSLVLSEVGLPNTSSWTITFDGVTYSPTGATLTLSVPNGTYPFSVTPPSAYIGNPSTGWVTVSGGLTALQVSFVKPLSALQSLGRDIPFVLGGFAVLFVLILGINLWTRRRRRRPPAETGRRGGPVYPPGQKGQGARPPLPVPRPPPPASDARIPRA